jgi:4-amino-4-deoxy-L-arabinose transferase-like glycosyltransferase
MSGLGKYRSFLPAIPVLMLCAFFLFYRLDTLPIRQWDEARNAVSALEMLQNHNYIVRYFDRSPDYWDVKPPLLIWMQVLSLKFFGLNETAIRLPSALAALLTAVFVLLYFKRYHRSMIPAILAVLILVTSPGYMGRHVARTGDHDALLVLFTTAVLFLGFEFLYAKRLRHKLLVGCAVGFFLGILTKSVAIFMILPGLATMTFFFGRQKRLLYSPAFHISLAVILLLTSGYYLWRESLQPGYFKAVWNGELFPRYFNASSDFNSGSFFYYMGLFFTERYPYWIYFMLASVAIIPFIANHKTKAFAVFLLINALMYLVVISAGTKNMWYDAPLYPLFATIIGIAAYDAMLRLRSFSIPPSACCAAFRGLRNTHGMRRFTAWAII